MKSKTFLSAAALTCFLSPATTPALHAEDVGFKCYGVSGPADNDCDPLDHQEHTCGGVSKRDRHIGDWKVVESAESCKKQGGLSEEDARKKLGLSPA